MTRFVRAILAAGASLLGTAPAAAADWTWPLRGEIVTPYRNGADPYAGGQHRGIDIAGRVGDAVVAAVPGRVRFAGTAGSSGLTVSVRSADGRFDLSYLHLSSVAVRAGDEVAAGTRLGAVGTSGVRSLESPHLHFGVREAGTQHAYLDPLGLLPPLPADAPGEPAPVPVAAPAPARPERIVAPVPRSPVAVPEPRAGTPRLARWPEPVPVHGPARPVKAGAAGSPALAPGAARGAGVPAAGGAAAGPLREAGLGRAPDAGGLRARSENAAPPAARPGGQGREGAGLGRLLACAGLLGAALALSTGLDRHLRGARARLAALAPVLGGLAGRGLRWSRE
jgi:hypothetical protein